MKFGASILDLPPPRNLESTGQTDALGALEQRELRVLCQPPIACPQVDHGIVTARRDAHDEEIAADIERSIRREPHVPLKEEAEPRRLSTVLEDDAEVVRVGLERIVHDGFDARVPNFLWVRRLRERVYRDIGGGSGRRREDQCAEKNVAGLKYG
ncbi:hypothetical protein FB451DRAFT_1172084 [Mycena latifolia]|nr:hypothetical protein FB451DRAFT_1172084 [Mycena latifolia]